MEKEGIKAEKDAGSRGKPIVKELEKLYVERDRLKEHWQREKSLVAEINTIKEKIEKNKYDIEAAMRDADYEKAARLRYGVTADLEKQLEKTIDDLAETQSVLKMLKEEIDADDIADIVSRWTGVPVRRLTESETDKLLHLEEYLHKRVIGQDEAVNLVSQVVRSSRAGLSDPDKPTGSFIFLGPTGVGKTELAKTLAEFLFGSEESLIRIDMSEYTEKYSVSRLIGAPPGYVGYEEGGQLTEAVRRHPYSVVLFDELEKAHPEVLNVLLQVLDDGRLTDNQGRVVNFKNTILIMTSNLGSDLITRKYETMKDSGQAEIYSGIKEEILDMLKHTLKPEFFNRIDEIIVFKPLSLSEIREIVDLEFDRIRKRLMVNNIRVKFTAKAGEILAARGYDPQFGARPLRRVVKRLVGDKLANKILAGEIVFGDSITVDGSADGLIIKVD